MKAPAVIASVTIACSLGFAAGQGRPAMPSQDMATPPVPPKDSMARGGSGDQGGVAMQVVGEGQCVIGEPLNWFTTVHVLPPCSRALLGWDYSFIYDGANDVDGDGRGDRFVSFDYVQPSGSSNCDESGCLDFGGSSYQIQFNGSVYAGTGQGGSSGIPFPFPSAIGLYRYSLSNSSGVPTVTYQSVLSGTVLSAAFCAVAPCDVPNQNLYVFQPKQFHDWDGDGDLDLVAKLVWGLPDDNWLQRSAMVVIENTVKSDSPLAADINGDGIVDGKDLASVLAAWTL